MAIEQQPSKDLALAAVPQVGRLLATGESEEPYRLVDAAGRPVEPVAAFFRDLQAAGRSASTLRSYGLDLLRWFRFVWAVDAVWDRATRAEARDFRVLRYIVWVTKGDGVGSLPAMR